MKRYLISAPHLAVAVSTYRPRERHPRHVDEHSRISFLIDGACREDAGARGATFGPGEVLLKSRSAPHEDQFGEAGARLVSLEFRDHDPFDAAHWRLRADAAALRHAVTILDAALGHDENAAATAGADLVALSADERRTAPPAWIARLHRALEETGLADVTVADQARAAGVHPAQASRLFRQCYGVSITEHAQTHGVRRALTWLADANDPLSQIALKAGFYDQAHMTRVFRRVTHRTPGEHRALMAAARQ